MELRETLQFIDPAFDGRTKDDVLKRIAELVGDSDSEDIYNALQEREMAGSTGFGNGIALPHARLESIDSFKVGIIVSQKGIDFDAVDGKKVRIFAFIVGPKEKRTEHISILSALSRVLKSEDARKDILAAKDSEDLRKRFLSHAAPETGKNMDNKPRCLFSVVIQRQEYFSDILELFSAEVPGEISVLEASNAGRYLHSMPLFAGYWNEKPDNFNRIILAVVDKTIMNDLVRRIQTILDGDNEGIHIAVQDLIYSWGKLDF